MYLFCLSLFYFIFCFFFFLLLVFFLSFQCFYNKAYCISCLSVRPRPVGLDFAGAVLKFPLNSNVKALHSRDSFVFLSLLSYGTAISVPVIHKQINWPLRSCTGFLWTVYDVDQIQGPFCVCYFPFAILPGFTSCPTNHSYSLEHALLFLSFDFFPPPILF